MGVSSELAWAVIRNNSCHLLKLRGVKKPFNTDPLNLTNKNTLRHSGLAQPKAVGIAAAPDNKGVVLSTKRARAAHKPAKAVVATTLKAGPRRSLQKIRSVLTKQRYRKVLTKAALKKASAIARSQKPIPARKGAKEAKKE